MSEWNFPQHHESPMSKLPRGFVQPKSCPNILRTVSRESLDPQAPKQGTVRVRQPMPPGNFRPQKAHPQREKPPSPPRKNHPAALLQNVPFRPLPTPSRRANLLTLPGGLHDALARLNFPKRLPTNRRGNLQQRDDLQRRRMPRGKRIALQLHLPGKLHRNPLRNPRERLRLQPLSKRSGLQAQPDRTREKFHLHLQKRLQGQVLRGRRGALRVILRKRPMRQRRGPGGMSLPPGLRRGALRGGGSLLQGGFVRERRALRGETRRVPMRLQERVHWTAVPNSALRLPPVRRRCDLRESPRGKRE